MAIQNYSINNQLQMLEEPNAFTVKIAVDESDMIVDKPGAKHYTVILNQLPFAETKLRLEMKN